MRRRRVLLAGASCAGLANQALQAQTAAPGPLRRIGLLVVPDAASYTATLRGFHRALQQQGRVEGRDYAIDIRHANGDPAALPRLAAELEALSVAVIATATPRQALAGTTHTPVVAVGLPPEQVASVAAPADRARLTGIDMALPAINVKRLEVLAEMLPRGSRVLSLGSHSPPSDAAMALADAAALRMGLAMNTRLVADEAEIVAAFAEAARQRVAGVNTYANQLLHHLRPVVMREAARHRLPCIFEWPYVVHEGALAGYGIDLAEFQQQYMRLAWRVASGTPPASLPIEQPTRIGLAVNLRSAREIGYHFPPALLARASEVVE